MPCPESEAYVDLPLRWGSGEIADNSGGRLRSKPCSTAVEAVAECRALLAAAEQRAIEHETARLARLAEAEMENAVLRYDRMIQTVRSEILAGRPIYRQDDKGHFVKV